MRPVPVILRNEKEGSRQERRSKVTNSSIDAEIVFTGRSKKKSSASKSTREAETFQASKRGKKPALSRSRSEATPRANGENIATKYADKTLSSPTKKRTSKKAKTEAGESMVSISTQQLTKLRSFKQLSRDIDMTPAQPQNKGFPRASTSPVTIEASSLGEVDASRDPRNETLSVDNEERDSMPLNDLLEEETKPTEENASKQNDAALSLSGLFSTMIENVNVCGSGCFETKNSTRPSKEEFEKEQNYTLGKSASMPASKLESGASEGNDDAPLLSPSRSNGLSKSRSYDPDYVTKKELVRSKKTGGHASRKFSAQEVRDYTSLVMDLTFDTAKREIMANSARVVRVAPKKSQPKKSRRRGFNIGWFGGRKK